MRLQIIGCHAATPRYQCNPSSQLLEAGGHLILIDCGEGTQMALRRYRIRFSRIEHIFISHLHGDHFFGLPGLVSTFRLLGRERPLHIYGPKGLREAITMLLKLGDSWTQYPLHFHELESKEPEIIFEDAAITIRTLPLKHRVYTNGFLVRQKPGLRKLRIGAAKAHGIETAYYRKIKQGADVPGSDGKLVPNHLLTEAPPEPASYAYCSDTSYYPQLAEWISGVHTLYHESTFLESEARLGYQTGHSTAREAALIAREAGVSRLILGHFSTRYGEHAAFREEAATIFPETELAEDGRVFTWDDP